MSNHYEVLGVDSKASADEISAAYRRLARRLHPDLNPDGAEAFAAVNAAHTILGDADERVLYDSQRASGGASAGVPEAAEDVWVDDVEWVDAVVDDGGIVADDARADAEGSVLGRCGRGLGAVLALVAVLMAARYSMAEVNPFSYGALLAAIVSAGVVGLVRRGVFVWGAVAVLGAVAISPLGFWFGLWPVAGLGEALGWSSLYGAVIAVAAGVLRSARFPVR